MAKKADPNQTDMFVSDTRAYRYTIVIHPGFQISEKVKQLKQLLHSITPISDADLFSKPHITLCYKDKDYKADDQIIEQVKSAIAGISGFDINVNGFNYWESSKVFFLKLKDQGPIFKLILTLQEKLNVSQGKEPHITITRGLKKKYFESLPLEEFEYESSFSCKSLTILKNIIDHPGGKTETLAKIKFPG